MTSRTTVGIRNVNSTTSILDIQGEIDAFAENGLMGAYNQINTNGVKTILLNFSEVEYMNSSGIGLLVTLLIRCNRQNQSLAAFNLSDYYRQIFELTRLNEAITIYPSEQEALASVN